MRQFYIFLVSVFFILLLGCESDVSYVTKQSLNTNDLPEIVENKKLVAITNYNSIDYFIYRGKPMGYQYELLNLFADHLDIKLEIKVNNDLEQNFKCLLEDDCDIIAVSLTNTKERSKKIDFTESIGQTKQVLVQRKPEEWRSLSSKKLDEYLIRNQLDLAGKTVFVQKNTAFSERLQNLSDEIGDSIIIVEIDSLEVEEIVKMVADGLIDYTVCDENVALVNATYYSNLDIKTAVSFPQNLAWGIRKDSDSLEFVLNSWLNDFKSTSGFRLLYNKYFKNPRSAKMLESDFHSISGGKISKYDDLIKIYAKEISWDWKLLASLIFQESRFQPNVKSWAGAIGLMQLMPSTARRFGADSLSSPAQNISAGVKYIKYLDETFFEDITNPEERIKFLLASYNVGPGHVQDARKLAEKFNKKNDIWEDNVDYFLLHKSNPKYYLDEVVKNGYCRGVEPYNFVYEVSDRYEHYKNIVKD